MPWTKWIRVGLLAGCLLAAPAAAAPAPARGEISVQLSQWTLSNGLKVIYAPLRAVPAVTVQVWYHTGSKNERPNQRGIAHLFEHMMFKGSRHVPPEEHARMLAAIGGTVNAFTTEDMTAYHDTLPRQYMEFAMKLEAERMRNLLLTPATIASERKVVMEEKRMRMENSPIGRAIEAIHALAYTRHPYAWTPAGHMKDLMAVTLKDCERFYHTYYAPGNATLVVVGDVDAAQVHQAAERQFGAIPAGPKPPPVTAVEPPQKAMRQQDADWPSQLNVVLGAYHIPSARGEDIPALKVLSAVLSAGRSSRLYRELVRHKKVALAAGGFVREQEDPGLLMVYAIGLPQQGVQPMQEALLAEVEGMATKPPTKEELTKARNQLVTGTLRGLATAEGLAMSIGESAVVMHDPLAFTKLVKELDGVKAADVQRVAKTYLVRSNLSVIRLGPSVKPAKPAKPSATQKSGGAR